MPADAGQSRAQGRAAMVRLCVKRSVEAALLPGTKGGYRQIAVRLNRGTGIDGNETDAKAIVDRQEGPASRGFHHRHAHAVIRKPVGEVLQFFRVSARSGACAVGSHRTRALCVCRCRRDDIDPRESPVARIGVIIDIELLAAFRRGRADGIRDGGSRCGVRGRATIAHRCREAVAGWRGAVGLGQRAIHEVGIAAVLVRGNCEVVRMPGAHDKLVLE